MLLEIYLYYLDAYTAAQLLFHWRNTDPVEFSEDLEMPQFNIEDHYIQENCEKKYHTGIILQKRNPSPMCQSFRGIRMSCSFDRVI